MGLGWLGAWGLRGLRFEIESEGRTRRLALSASQVVWLGCAADCHVVLDAPGVAPKHLSVFVRRGELFVRDHSAHGTRVEGQRLRLGLRRVAVPARLELGPYRVRVSLGPAWLGLGLASLGIPGRGGLLAPREASAPPRGGSRGMGSLVRPVHPWWLAAAAAAIGLGFARALLWPSPRPPVAAAACAVERTDPGDSARASGAGDAARALVTHGAGAPSVLRAVQLLRAGRRVEALSQYKALSARDDSPAPLAVVAGLLEYELACPR